jgi:hypothetical protein
MSGLTILLVALGVPALIVLLALWYRSMMRKLTAIWAPNTQLVQGTFSRFRALLRGTYQGRPVVAFLANESGPEDAGPKTYSYILYMTVPAEFENWSAVCQVPRKGEPPAWRLKAKPGPADQLTAAGLLAALEQAPKNLRFRYRAGSGRIQLSIPGAGMYFCPDVQSFQWQLDFLSRLAAITHAAAGPSVRQAA